MEHNFPSPITGEKDLNYYENYLKKSGGARTVPAAGNESGGYKMTVENGNRGSGRTLPPALCDTSYLPGYLCTMIGKLVRVESLIGRCLESRVGTLMQVGADFIVIKLYQSCSTMICEASSVKYITVIHDNDSNKIGLY